MAGSSGGDSWVMASSAPFSNPDSSIVDHNERERECRRQLTQDIEEFGEHSMPAVISKSNLATAIADSDPEVIPPKKKF